MPGMNLTRDEATARAAVIAVDHYDVTLDLTTSDTTFRSTTTITFTSAEPGVETFVDLIAPSVEAITLNGEPLDPATHFDGVRVRVPATAERNTLTVDATAAYMNTGEGLHRFTDPVDGEVYLYSQFEVADCRRMFAVFEQPDLKATFAFTVTAPDHWQVVSNSPTPEPTPVRAGVATWAFGTTARMSCYITALVAGPYAVVRDEVETRRGTVPLGIFCRQSLLEHLDADNVFACTKLGFAFFEEEFDCEYPFEKYDQLFTPEYNMGAMENAGAVTISEIYVFRSKVTEALVERRALTLLHELAHMWFGNLVTMKWWNDLWLNESFAEWASTTCQAEATEWTSAWTTFGTSEKSWAYRQDQLSSTHPIVAPIRDLQDVEVNFDGITYAKGASVLKQLVAYVGREPFTAGLRAYFAKHAWGNTRLEDLLRELEATSGRDLGSWSKLWLETAGVNTLHPEIDTDDQGLVSSARIVQTYAEGFETLRPHRLAVGLYDVDDSAPGGGALVRTDRIELDVDGESTDLPQLVGRPAPDLLLVNDDDLAYAKIRLDERSLATALAHPRGFQDSLPRALVLGAAWDMTRDAEMSARDFAALVLASLPGETDSTLLRVLLGQLQTALHLYVAPAHREAALASAARDLRALAVAAEPGSDAQLQLVGAYAAHQRGGEDAAYLRGLLDGTEVLDGLAIDTDMRWRLLTTLAACGAATTADIDAELARDNTATGREHAEQARASFPTAEAKAEAWRRGVEETGLPNSILESVAAGFATVHDNTLLEPYVEKYHAMLDTVEGKGSHAIIEILVRGFYPTVLADQRLHDATEAWLLAHPDAPAALRRLVTENRDPIARALRAQQRDADA
ncbi:MULTISPECIES: aminopeptidase N [unclassified Phycicoccus]|uniref:aminopeptidase N n=1 Tax=unclassified Phycicoccus TaxID=2637926 RepID=UPI0007031730|nr:MULTISPECIES: aminopeptidase N [unclassified Phycicoccus]KRF22881.1 aminopeptidase N [Phycicoccus sp. Soil802]KRF24443.1 aminopeptidase N [Phycicoccus sp. Soil803]